MQLRSGADARFLAAPDARVYEQYFLSKECRLLAAGPGAMWVDQSIFAESRVVATSPGGRALALRTIRTEPRLYLLVNWPPLGGLGVSREPGLVWPHESFSHLASAFLGGRDYLGLSAILQQPALADGVPLFMPILNETISPLVVSGLEWLGLSSNVARVLGKGGTAIAVATVISPWAAHLLAGAVLIHFTSLVLPFGEAGAWPSDKFVMDWAKKTLINHSPKPVSDALPVAMAIWRSLADRSAESDLEARRRRPAS